MIKRHPIRPFCRSSHLEPFRALGLALVKRFSPEQGNSQLSELWSCAAWITLSVDGLRFLRLCRSLESTIQREKPQFTGDIVVPCWKSSSACLFSFQPAGGTAY